MTRLTCKQNKNKTSRKKDSEKNTTFFDECVSQQCPCYLLMVTVTGLVRNNKNTPLVLRLNSLVLQ